MPVSYKICIAIVVNVVIVAFAQAQILPRFTAQPSSHTGITFQNKLAESPELNIITYEYYYNGGGVATADFNKDGLVDIYLSGNMAPNKLYLNKGDLQFVDVTKAANAAGKRGWKTGVSIADVNGDGWLDIYLCYSGDLDKEMRRNQLLISNGNPTALAFTDMAMPMGVADEGHTTQAAFFDYDKDGDLDLFVLNHNIKTLRNFDAAFVKKMVDPDAGDRLYRNDNNHFTDVTLAAGIVSNPLGYGLSVTVSDINNDGWPDLYVTNDYVEEDYLYINNGNGTFTDRLKEQIGHISNFSMGADIADINNDGWPEIFTLDMLPADNKRQKLLYAPDNYELYNNQLANGFYHQLMRNMLQLNNANGSFSEIGQISGISNTDWSWAALFADYDNDGFKDLMVTNGYGRDMINRDFLKFYANERLKFLKGEPSEKMFQMLQGIKTTPLNNYLFQNLDGLQFADRSAEWGFTEADLSHGAAYADFDNDGDLDLVINRMNEEARLYKNNTSRTHYLQVSLRQPGANAYALGAKVYVYAKTKQYLQENYPLHGFQSAMQVPLHFGVPVDDIDSLKIKWPDGKWQLVNKPPIDTLLTITYNATGTIDAVVTNAAVFKPVAAPPLLHKEDVANDFKQQPLMPNMLSYSGPRIAQADVDGDKLEDLYMCGTKGNAGVLLLQLQGGGYAKTLQSAFEQDAAYEDTDAVFFDADGDGDQDLYVVSGGYAGLAAAPQLLQDRLYLNNDGVFELALDRLPSEQLAGAVVKAADIDADGDIDLFVGSRVVPGRYPESPASLLLINNGKGYFKNEIAVRAPGLANLGMVTDACFIADKQGKYNSLLLCGEWMSIKLFKQQDGVWQDVSAAVFTDSLSGWWNRLAMADLDADGDLDIIAANWGLNSQLKASEQEPVEIFYADFDNNGYIDPLLCYYIQGKSWPLASRDDITDQITSKRQVFPNYDTYANADILKLLTPEQYAMASKRQANCFETIWLQNNGGVYQKRSLPLQANYAPVHAIATQDFNGDGFTDILLAGNVEHTTIKIGKVDANYGVLLSGDGKGNFNYIPQLQSGLSVKGCVRDIQLLRHGNRKQVLFAINNAAAVAYEF
jgi:enediyne biosynthesis protein E4